MSSSQNAPASQCVCHDQRLPPRLPGPLPPEPGPGLLGGQQVPAPLLEDQADAHQGHREEGGRARGGVGRRPGRQAGGEEEDEEEEGEGVGGGY